MDFSGVVRRCANGVALQLRVPARSRPAAGPMADARAAGSGVHRSSHRLENRNRLADSAEFRRRMVFAVHFYVTLMLATLLLAACESAPAPVPAPTARPTSVHRQPMLRTRVLPPETSTPLESPETVQPTATTPDSTAFTQVAPGENHACALQRDGRVHCWGANDQGQLDVPEGSRFRQITSGWRFSCGLQLDGQVTCWGRNNHKQAEAPSGQFTAVDTGWDHACAISHDGPICWGRNADGRSAPPPDIRLAVIGAGAEHTCGLTLERDLVCWGKNDNRRADQRTGPFQALTVGIAHTCILASDGRSFCQGDNTSRQSNPPGTVFQQIAAGSDVTCGLLPVGSLECWGSNRHGETNARIATPQGIFASLSSGWNSMCALSDQGYVQCWGYTVNGTLFSPYLPSGSSHTYLVNSLSPPYYTLSLTDAFPGHSFEQPIEILPWPDGGIAVVDRKGYITLHTTGTKPERILDLSDRVYSDGAETGMLSAALDPRIGSQSDLFVYYSVRIGKDREYPDARLARIPIVDRRPVREEETVVLEIKRASESEFHYGGTIRFGPDGMLYLGIGDSDCLECPQNLNSLHGKIIRIDVRGASAERPYLVPDDNPFLDRPDARAEVWAYGLRNPWRMAFDERDGTLWVGDVGRAIQEEVSLVVSGANLGWPIFEGADCFIIPDSVTERERRILAGYQCSEFEDATTPIVTYGRSFGCPADTHCPQSQGLHPTITYGEPSRCAVVGGFVYRGAEIPWLQGVYVFGDFCSGQVWALDGDTSEGRRMFQIADLPNPLSSFGVDESGEVYVLTFGGPIFRLVEVEKE